MTLEQWNKRRAEIIAQWRATTKGNWYVVEAPWRPTYYDKDAGEHRRLTTYVVAGNPDPHGGRAVLDGMEFEEWTDDADYNAKIDQSDADLQFAADAKQTVPELVKIIDKLLKLRPDALQEQESK